MAHEQNRVHFQSARDAVVVFLYDEYKAVKTVQLIVPSGSLLCSFAQKRRLVISDINDFVVCISAFISDTFNPFTYLRA